MTKEQARKKYMKQIVLTLNKIGVPANICGYEYLKEALVIVLADKYKIHDVIKRVYLEVSETCDAKWQRVERGIRTAIDTVFNNMSSNIMEEYFGGCTKLLSGKVAASQFIAIVAERIRLDCGDYD